MDLHIDVNDGASFVTSMSEHERNHSPSDSRSNVVANDNKSEDLQHTHSNHLLPPIHGEHDLISPSHLNERLSFETFNSDPSSMLFRRDEDITESSEELSNCKDAFFHDGSPFNNSSLLDVELTFLESASVKKEINSGSLNGSIQCHDPISDDTENKNDLDFHNINNIIIPQPDIVIQVNKMDECSKNGDSHGEDDKESIDSLNSYNNETTNTQKSVDYENSSLGLKKENISDSRRHHYTPISNQSKFIPSKQHFKKPSGEGEINLHHQFDTNVDEKIFVESTCKNQNEENSDYCSMSAISAPIASNSQEGQSENNTSPATDFSDKSKITSELDLSKDMLKKSDKAVYKSKNVYVSKKVALPFMKEVKIDNKHEHPYINDNAETLNCGFALQNINLSTLNASRNHHYQPFLFRKTSTSNNNNNANKTSMTPSSPSSSSSCSSSSVWHQPSIPLDSTFRRVSDTSSSSFHKTKRGTSDHLDATQQQQQELLSDIKLFDRNRLRISPSLAFDNGFHHSQSPSSSPSTPPSCSTTGCNSWEVLSSPEGSYNLLKRASLDPPAHSNSGLRSNTLSASPVSDDCALHQKIIDYPSTLNQTPFKKKTGQFFNETNELKNNFNSDLDEDSYETMSIHSSSSNSHRNSMSIDSSSYSSSSSSNSLPLRRSSSSSSHSDDDGSDHDTFSSSSSWTITTSNDEDKNPKLISPRSSFTIRKSRSSFTRNSSITVKHQRRVRFDKKNVQVRFFSALGVSWQLLDFESSQELYKKAKAFTKAHKRLSKLRVLSSHYYNNNNNNKKSLLGSTGSSIGVDSETSTSMDALASDIFLCGVNDGDPPPVYKQNEERRRLSGMMMLPSAVTSLQQQQILNSVSLNDGVIGVITTTSHSRRNSIMSSSASPRKSSIFKTSLQHTLSSSRGFQLSSNIVRPLFIPRSVLKSVSRIDPHSHGITLDEIEHGNNSEITELADWSEDEEIQPLDLNSI